MSTPQIPAYDPLNFGNEPGQGPLRVGGQTVAQPSSSSKDNLPSTRCQVSERQMAACQMLRDLAAGPAQVRAQKTLYLPKGRGEQQADYDARIARSVYHNFLGHTLEGLTGMVFRRDPVLEDDVPAVIAQHWEAIDDAGTHGAVFSREALEDALTVGHAFILVEFPRTDGRQTFRDEQKAIRPYWILVKKEQVLSWRTVKEGGRLVLTQVVIEEKVTLPKGEFGEQDVTRYRVFNRDENGGVTYRLLYITPAKEVVELEAGSYPTQTEIPIVEVTTGGRLSLFESEPPLLDLAYLNVAHYQEWSDYAWSRHKSNVPLFFTAGIQIPYGTELVIGPNMTINAPDPNAKAEYVSHSGAAHESSKRALDDLKADMATLGLAMLSPQTRAAETAEAKRIDKSTSDSALAVAARGLQDALEAALQLHANYLREKSGGSVVVNRDFENLRLSAQDILALSTLVREDQLTLETMWGRLVEGNVLSDDFDPDEERARIEAERAIRAAMAPQVQMAGPDGEPEPDEPVGPEQLAA